VDAVDRQNNSSVISENLSPSLFIGVSSKGVVFCRSGGVSSGVIPAPLAV